MPWAFLSADQLDQAIVADRPMSIAKAYEPMRHQALDSELAVE
jgi:hypothetical protein